MSYKQHHELIAKDGLRSASYEFSTSENDYIISFSRSRSSAHPKGLYITRFDIKERMLVSMVQMAPIATEEGVPLKVYENIAECVGAFYYKYRTHVDNILMKGILTPEIYEWLVNRYGPTYNPSNFPLTVVLYDWP